MFYRRHYKPAKIVTTCVMSGELLFRSTAVSGLPSVRVQSVTNPSFTPSGYLMPKQAVRELQAVRHRTSGGAKAVFDDSRRRRFPNLTRRYQPLACLSPGLTEWTWYNIDFILIPLVYLAYRARGASLQASLRLSSLFCDLFVEKKHVMSLFLAKGYQKVQLRCNRFKNKNKIAESYLLLRAIL